MNDLNLQPISHPETFETNLTASLPEDRPDQDDRYPGSFFTIPGPPIPGKTTWSIC
jgi:hypothetical protein